MKNDPQFDPNALRLGAKIFADKTLGAAVKTKKAALALGEHVLGIAFAGGFPIEWVEAAIDDAAGEVLAAQIGGESPSVKAVCQTVIRYARRPRRPRTMADEAGNESEIEHRARVNEERAAIVRRVEAEEAKAVRKPELVGAAVKGVLDALEERRTA